MTTTRARCRQQTVSHPIEIAGIGLHRGEPARARVFPAAVDTGIVFVREDLGPHARIPARAEYVIDTRMCTTLSLNDVRVQTIEHLLAALYGMGIDNAEVHVSGPEIPIMDGSAIPMVDAIARAGLSISDAPLRTLSVTEPLEVRDGVRFATLLPPTSDGLGLEVECTLEFDHPLISNAPFVYSHSPQAFVRDICQARTFGFVREVEALRSHGLALGGSLDNAVVFDDDSVKTPGGLRYTDECARHKVLDALGDLSLTGAVVEGRLRLHRSGHGLHVALAKALLLAHQGANRRAQSVTA